MSKNNAVCYVADRGYLAPTIASICSILRNGDPSFDILVYCVDTDARTISTLRRTFADGSVRFMDLPRSWASLFDRSKWRGDLSDTTIGRFFMDDQISLEYEKILYLDGDTLISHDLSPLFDIHLDDGEFAAAADSLSFCRHHSTSLGRDVRPYFKNIGLKEGAVYFNCGVMMANSRTWLSLKENALSFLTENTAICHHHDQTAVNMTYRDSIKPLSTRWNFQENFHYWGCLPGNGIALEHGKTWKERAWPLLHLSRVYDRIIEESPILIELGLEVGGTKLYKSSRRAAKMLRLATTQAAELSLTRSMFTEYESNCVA